MPPDGGSLFALGFTKQSFHSAIRQFHGGADVSFRLILCAKTHSSSLSVAYQFVVDVVVRKVRRRASLQGGLAVMGDMRFVLFEHFAAALAQTGFQLSAIRCDRSSTVPA